METENVEEWHKAILSHPPWIERILKVRLALVQEICGKGTTLSLRMDEVSASNRV